ESVLWDMLKGNNIGYHFRRQHIILDYILDFICLDKGLVIELDGGYHNNPEQKEYDAQRTAHLQRLGYTELRFKNEELLCDPVSVIAKITETLQTLPSLQGRVGDRLAEEMYTFSRTPQRVWWVGNVMIDTLLANRARFTKPAIYDELCLQEKNYVVMTMHRPANVDEEQHLKALMEQIITNVHGLPIIFPIHPRTAKIFYNLWGDEEQLRVLFPNLHIVDPMGYLAFNYLVEHAKVVVTDSGGITEETTVMGVPCITLRDNTERPETCTIGTNRLIGTNPDAIKPALDALFAGQWQQGAIPPLWDGHTAERIVEILYSLKFKD
ncbi:MAG: UDP-N-acetylglucosamine 2-epimerase, partial [Paludibacteraceae bacterium]|nr:UDP-N-acetylglucosamine 2-epimerase [Paludibacteraceae bacterium]